MSSSNKSKKIPNTDGIDSFIYRIYLINFLDLLAVGAIVTQLPPYVKSLGGSFVFIGLLGSLYSGCQLASGPIIGSLSDIRGRKNVFWWTLTICSAAYLTIGLTTSIYLILALRVVLGITKQTQMLTKALVPDYVKDEATQSAIYGKMAALSSAGMALGPIISGHIVEDIPKYGFFIVATFTGSIFLLNSYLIGKFRDDAPEPKKVDKKAAAKSPLDLITSNCKQSIHELLSIDWPNYWDIFTFKAIASFAMGLFFCNYAVYLKTTFSLSPKQVGYTVSYLGVIGSVCSFLIEYVNTLYKNDHDFTKRNFHVFCLFTSSLFGMALADSVLTYVVFLTPLAIASAVGRLVTLEMLIQKSPAEHRGTMIGASSSVRSISGVVAPLVAGFIGDYIGVPAVLHSAVFTALLGVIVSFNIRAKSSNAKLVKSE